MACKFSLGVRKVNKLRFKSTKRDNLGNYLVKLTSILGNGLENIIR